MIAGHFGLAAIVKSRAPSVPLWSLMLASVWMDVLFVPLFAAGVEPIVPVPGTHGGYGQGIIHADYTHSLLGALVIAGLTGALCAWRWGRRGGLVLGVTVFSHWLLDLPMHHHDMPILPGAAGHLPRLGFGLWSLPVASAVLELALVLLGAWMYLRAATAVARPAGDAMVQRARGISLAMVAVGALVLGLNVLGM